MIHKAYKYRIYPDDQQAQLIHRTFGCARLVWNLMLEDLKASYVKTKKFTYPTPAHYKKEFPYLAEVDSYALCNAWMNIKQALGQFLKDRKNPKKKKKSGFPTWKKKHKARRSYTTNCSHGNIQIKEGKLQLPKLGLVETVFHRRLFGKIKSVTVSQDPSGKYYASILTEQPDVLNDEIDDTDVIGLDFSFASLFVTPSGARLKPLDWLKQEEWHLRKQQRRLGKKTKGSKGYAKQKIIVAKIHEYIRNRRTDQLHRYANKLLDRHDVIVLEDIDLSGLAKRSKVKHKKRFGRSVARLAFGTFRSILKQQAEQRGKLVITVSRWFPSSQICHVCGERHRETKDLSVRQWTCPVCGTHHDRDINAARNLTLLYLFNKSTGVENPVEIRLHSTNPSSEQYVGHLLTKGFHAPATIVVATTVSTEPKHIKSAWITNLPVKGLLVWAKDSEP